jgi:hypothetical protein
MGKFACLFIFGWISGLGQGVLAWVSMQSPPLWNAWLDARVPSSSPGSVVCIWGDQTQQWLSDVDFISS